jgi:RNA polymerase sigma-70 factor, ECF subfamily
VIEDLYRQFSASIYRVCLRYVDSPEDAEDLTHDIFLKAGERYGGFRGDCQIFTWLYRIAVNECLQLLRKRKREVSVDDTWLSEALTAEGADRPVETRLLLRKLFEGCDGKIKETVLLLYYEGLKQEEVAETLNISRRMVNKRLEKFQSLMGQKGVLLKEGGFR